jgi:hypothetical protein
MYSYDLTISNPTKWIEKLTMVTSIVYFTTYFPSTAPAIYEGGDDSSILTGGLDARPVVWLPWGLVKKSLPP